MSKPHSFTLLHFLFKNLLLGGIYLILGFLVFSKTSLSAYYLPIMPYMLLGIIFLNVGIFALLAGVAQRDSSLFIKRFFSVTGIKLILFLAIMLIYIRTSRETAYAFVGAFFALYLGYSILEVREIVGLTKKTDPKK